MSVKKPSLLNILSETSHIITTHPRQFLTLSILFILPNSIAAIIYTFLSQPPSLRHLRLLSGDSPPYSTPASSEFPIQIIFLVSTYLFSLCTITSITYTTFHGFHGEPVDLLASLKSILVSFFPLIATTLAVQTIFILIIFVFTFVALVSYNGLALLGLQVDYNGTYFLVIVLACMLFGLLIYLQVELYLVKAAVILESKWGFAPLKRSWYLVKGMRGVVFLVMMLFAIPSFFLSLWFMRVVVNVRGMNGGLTAWIGLQAIVYIGFSVMLQLYALVANTVVFVHCKAIHEESALQIDDVPGLVYVQLPSDVV